ncbi:CPBP family intramembrane glutamic endopeptidase [uncultured Ruminococcus sp.]|uniref:CPBP family intramembrane glutamic endopeptidase n=1 Tax=uncultured Ruminococcus sp. TaxID=165186 RepID=UPI00262C4814|nr:type II CAAX endopeptidase family protein [uncultured Ruminococcus sp.]
MTTKKANAKRLAIYLLIVFAFSILLIILRKPISSSETFYFFIAELFCASPAVASLITRTVTKEGFRDMKLHLNLSRNFRWYLLAFALPLICFSASKLIPIIISGHSDWLSGFTFGNILAVILMLAAQSAVSSVSLLGEELGWRGYMNQKMEPLLGTVGTCLFGGVVWGLWHFPIDIANYLEGYGTLSNSLETAFGRLILLVCFGVFLMWLTKKTNSVFPAVVAHFMFNMSQTALMSLLSQGNIPENADLGMIASVFEYVTMILLAVGFMTLLLYERKKAPKTP